MTCRRPPTRYEILASRLVAEGKALCILCGGPPVAFGFWEPDPATRRLLALSGRGRATLAYCLCAECAWLPDPSTRIEDAILADVAARQ